MISQTSEYALRAMVFLAERRNGLQAISQIAAATKVPASYLSKVMQNLAKANLVHSQRGPYGGFSLTRDIVDLTIYDIVQAVDPIQRITKCPLNLPTHAHELCALHCRLDQAAESIEKSFRETTLASLLGKPIFDAVADSRHEETSPC